MFRVLRVSLWLSTLGDGVVSLSLPVGQHCSQ